MHAIVVAALCEFVTRPGMERRSVYYVAKYLLARDGMDKWMTCGEYILDEIRGRG